MWYKIAQLEAYHGTSKKYEGFPKIQPGYRQFGPFIFVSENQATAGYFARGSNGRILKLNVDVKNPFDPVNIKRYPALLEQVANWANGAGYLGRYDWKPDLTNKSFDHLVTQIQNGQDETWILENTQVKAILKKLGFDAIKLKERGQNTYALFDNNQIKTMEEL